MAQASIAEDPSAKAWLQCTCQERAESKSKYDESTTDDSEGAEFARRSKNKQASSNQSPSPRPPDPRAEELRISQADSYETFSTNAIYSTNLDPQSDLEKERARQKPSGMSKSKDPPAPIRARHKLGKIGGKGKTDTANIEAAVEKGEESLDNMASAAQKAYEATCDARNPELPIPSPNIDNRSLHRQKEATSPQKVTEEQADENRKRLQQQLDDASKAAKKKKRKF